MRGSMLKKKKKKILKTVYVVGINGPISRHAVAFKSEEEARTYITKFSLEWVNVYLEATVYMNVDSAPDPRP